MKAEKLWWCDSCGSECYELFGTCRACGNPCRDAFNSAKGKAMQESLIAFIKAVQQRNLEDAEYRKEFTLTNGSKKIQFGYGYHDLGKVVFCVLRTREMETLTVEEAVSKFLGEN